MQRREDLAVSVSASHAIGRELAPRSGHTKDYHKNGTNCIFAWHAVVRIGVWQCKPSYVKGQVVELYMETCTMKISWGMVLHL